MPREKKPWFRVYVEMVRDRKLRRLSPAQRWLWVVVLALARESPRPGYLMLTGHEPLSLKDIAHEADTRLKDVETAIGLLCGPLGMLDFDTELQAWFIPSWWDRQFESDGRPHR